MKNKEIINFAMGHVLELAQLLCYDRHVGPAGDWWQEQGTCPLNKSGLDTCKVPGRGSDLHVQNTIISLAKIF